jgi:hypothetical protein
MYLYLRTQQNPLSFMQMLLGIPPPLALVPTEMFIPSRLLNKVTVSVILFCSSLAIRWFRPLTRPELENLAKSLILVFCKVGLSLSQLTHSLPRLP